MKELLFLSVVLSCTCAVLGNFEKCGTLFTETTGHLKTKQTGQSHYRESCTWTIIARNNELITLDISADKLPPDFTTLKVFNSFGSQSSSVVLAIQDKKVDSTLWIRGGKVEINVQFAPYYCAGCELEFKYFITTLNESKCEEVIEVKTTDSIRLPHKSLSIYDGGSMGCNVLIRLDGNQTLKTNLFVDLPDDKPLLLEVYEGNSSLHKSRNSKANVPLNPKSNSMLLSFRYYPDHTIVDPSKVFVELNIVNSELDCEFKDTLCGWTGQESNWIIKELKASDSPSKRMEKVASFNLSGKRGAWSELSSPILKTEDQDLCVKMEFRMFGPSAHAAFLVFSRTEDSVKMWSSFYNKYDFFSVASFNVPKNETGSARFIFIEGENGKNGKFELNYVRSSWGKCEKELCGWEQPGISWFPDLTGTEMFYKSGDSYKTNLPFVRSVARMESEVINPDNRGYCLAIEYSHIVGGAAFSVFLKSVAAKTNDNKYSFEGANERIQYAFNSTDHVKVYLQASKETTDNRGAEFGLIKAKLSKGYCGINCNFSLRTICAWTVVGSSTGVAHGENYFEMKHEYDKTSKNEIVSPSYWNLEDWFCLQFKIGSVPALCLYVGVYVDGKERVLTKQCGATVNQTMQCVPLPKQRPLQVFIRTTGEGSLSTDNVVQSDDENVRISSVWTSAECDEPNFVCGWSSENSKAVTWNVSPRDNGYWLVAQRSCCEAESREKGYAVSPLFKRSNGTTKVCLKFSYSFRQRNRFYHPTTVFVRQYGYPCDFPYGRIQVSGDTIHTIRKFNANNQVISTCTRGTHVLLHPNSQNISEFQLLLNDHNSVLLKRSEPEIGSTHNVSLTLNVADYKEYQIGFSAVLSRSSLQINDLTLSDGSCETDNFDVDFEDDLGAWSTSSDTFYSWSRVHSGSYNPRNLQTGPVVDCSLTPGGFAVANSSFEGKEAHLTSPELPAEARCIQFCYHMFGVGVGKLELRSGDRILWSKDGNQGNLWRKVQIPIPPGQKRIRFTARRGQFETRNELGDVAVDSVLSSPSVCEKRETVVDFPQFKEDKRASNSFGRIY